jgi:hypothetical protein
MKATELEMNFPVALDKGGKKQVAVEPPKPLANLIGSVSRMH